MTTHNLPKTPRDAGKNREDAPGRFQDTSTRLWILILEPSGHRCAAPEYFPLNDAPHGRELHPTPKDEEDGTRDARGWEGSAQRLDTLSDPSPRSPPSYLE